MLVVSAGLPAAAAGPEGALVVRLMLTSSGLTVGVAAASGREEQDGRVGSWSPLAEPVQDVLPQVQQPVGQHRPANARPQSCSPTVPAVRLVEVREDAVVNPRRRILADRSARGCRWSFVPGVARPDPRRVVDLEVRDRRVAHRNAVGLAVPFAAVVPLAGSWIANQNWFLPR